ncbi:MAG: alpha-amylase family glycosyl hydrolase, partial [Gaiellaceae bacterium]
MSFRALYRLQLGPELDFAGARRLMPYLRELGISHVYLSPVLQARLGSTHGYDVVDPTRVSEHLGGDEQLRALCREAPGVVLDIVPNHMAADEANPFWADEELRHRFFDVDPESGRHRRFFTIDDLAGVRVEDPEVFEVTHRKVLELAGEGLIDGVRVDHPDGLANPRKYLERLRERGLEHVWVEKILGPGEELRDWPIAGTTGYEFLNDVLGLFVDPAAEEAFTTLYREVSGETRSFAAVAHEAKLELVGTDFRPEVERLRALLDEPGLEEALASFQFYRTYVEPEHGRVEAADRAEVERAEVSERLARVLLLDEPGHEEFVTRFQQTTGAVMAKGVEDTAFYRYNRLIALNEVGGDPGRFGITVGEMHRANALRAEHHPDNLLISSTHDTKRSGDVRARIGALTEPSLREDWAAFARRWVPEAPDAGVGFMVLQTLLGAHPIEPLDRLDGFLEKALREAKLETTWAEPDEAYERGVQRWARGLLDDDGFRRDFDPLVERVAEAGRRAAFGQAIIRFSAPGIPDVYGGDELEY